LEVFRGKLRGRNDRVGGRAAEEDGIGPTNQLRLIGATNRMDNREHGVEEVEE